MQFVCLDCGAFVGEEDDAVCPRCGCDELTTADPDMQPARDRTAAPAIGEPTIPMLPNVKMAANGESLPHRE